LGDLLDRADLDPSAVAIHIAGNFPDLDLELWAIKG
jgi:type VI secretion system protein ImpJ